MRDMDSSEDDLRAHDSIVRRLRDVGHQPVDPDVAARHFALMASAASPPKPRRGLRPAVAGALVAGSLFGGMGLASALTGELVIPGPARTALEKVGLVAEEDADDEVSPPAPPSGSAEDRRNAAPAFEPGAGEGAGVVPGGEDFPPADLGIVRLQCPFDPDGAGPEAERPFTGTHGQWVEAHPDDPATPQNERDDAARSDCGKPLSEIPPPSPVTGPTGDVPGPGGDDSPGEDQVGGDVPDDPANGVRPPDPGPGQPQGGPAGTGQAPPAGRNPG